MSIILQISLLCASIFTLIFMLRKIRKAQLRIEDSLFWIFFALGLFVVSAFPQIAVLGAHLLEIQSASNFIFLAIIFVLLLKQFLITVKLSKLEYKLQSLVQHIAIKEAVHLTQNTDEHDEIVNVVTSEMV